MASLPGRGAADAARTLHDLRGPLSVIRGQCRLLRRDEPSPERRRRIGMIDVQARRLTDELDALIGARPPRSWTPVPMAELVRVVAHEHAPLVGEAGGRLRVAAGGAAIVTGEPRRLRRALENLLANAVRHSPSGGSVSVVVRLRPGWVWIDVADEGPGVPVDERALIFRPGWRAHDARGLGAGLGLATARAVAREHGGDLALVPSRRGARFRLSLPLHDPARDEGT